MKKTFLIISTVFNVILASILFICLSEQKDNKEHFDFSKYLSENRRIKDTRNSDSLRVIFLGNSITANWTNLSPAFFSNHKFLNRGVGGQTSSQMLLRFQQDVVDLDIKTVVLNTGINDIGEGDGFYRQDFTLQNIRSMIDIAQQNDIDLILTSVLPATDIYVHRFLKIADVQVKIDNLNKEIIKLADRNDLKYIDYNSKLRNSDGTFNRLYTFDGLHPNEEGYEIMEALIIENTKK